VSRMNWDRARWESKGVWRTGGQGFIFQSRPRSSASGESESGLAVSRKLARRRNSPVSNPDSTVCKVRWTGSRLECECGWNAPVDDDFDDSVLFEATSHRPGKRRFEASRQGSRGVLRRRSRRSTTGSHHAGDAGLQQTRGLKAPGRGPLRHDVTISGTLVECSCGWQVSCKTTARAENAAKAHVPLSGGTSAQPQPAPRAVQRPGHTVTIVGMTLACTCGYRVACRTMARAENARNTHLSKFPSPPARPSAKSPTH